MMVPLLVLIVTVFIPTGGVLAIPSTVPAFLWSSHYNLVSDNGLKQSVNYQVISPKVLAKSVLSEAGWSNFLCKGKKFQEPLDLALLFVGNELQSSDLSLNKNADSALLDLLKDSFGTSNTSMAFPYVSSSEEASLEDLLVSGFIEACRDGSGIGNVVLLGSCSMSNGRHGETSALRSLQDYLTSRMEESHNGKTDLVVFCNGQSQASKNVDGTQSEGEALSELISSVEESGQNMQFFMCLISRGQSSILLTGNCKGFLQKVQQGMNQPIPQAVMGSARLNHRSWRDFLWD